MKKYNFHLYPSAFLNESRIEKQAHTISSLGIFDEICLLGVHANGLERERWLTNRVSISLFGRENKKGGIIRKLVVFFIWYVSVVTFAFGKHVTCVNAHSLSALPLGYLIALFRQSKLIYDTHELETETNGSKGFRKILAKIIENIFIRKADHVFVVSESIADWYVEKYKIVRPTVILNSPKLIKISNSNKFRRKFGISDKQIIVLYQGVLAHGRGIDMLLSAFKQRDDDGKAVIVFMGYGELEERIREESKNSKNIYFHPAVPPDEVLDYTASADVGISFIENTCLSYYYCMPNKLFEYVMSGLPVIVSDMKEMRDFVEAYDVGVVVGDDTVFSINAAINELVEKDISTLRLNMQKAAQNNSWEVQERKLIESYRSLNMESGE